MKRLYLVLSVLALCGLVNAAVGYHVTRTMPHHVLAGETITVSLDVQAKNISTLGITQGNPEGWQTSNITCGGYKIRNNIEWLFWNGGTKAGDMTCSYQLLVPGTARGNYSVFGTYFKDGMYSWNVDGSRELMVYSTDLRTVIEAIHRWERDEITLAQVVQAINDWASGR